MRKSMIIMSLLILIQVSFQICWSRKTHTYLKTWSWWWDLSFQRLSASQWWTPPQHDVHLSEHPLVAWSPQSSHCATMNSNRNTDDQCQWNSGHWSAWLQAEYSLTRAVMVPCFSPLLLIILMPAVWNMRFISSGVAVVAKSTSSGRFPDSRSRTAPPAIRSSYWCFWNSSKKDQTHAQRSWITASEAHAISVTGSNLERGYQKTTPFLP